jgi:hypothetical protein
MQQQRQWQWQWQLFDGNISVGGDVEGDCDGYGIWKGNSKCHSDGGDDGICDTASLKASITLLGHANKESFMRFAPMANYVDNGKWQ